MKKVTKEQLEKNRRSLIRLITDESSQPDPHISFISHLIDDVKNIDELIREMDERESGDCEIGKYLDGESKETFGR